MPRGKHGDIVWFDWNSHETTSPAAPNIHFGITGIAINRAGAKWVQSKIPEMQVWHFDCELLKHLQRGQAKASFVYPSVGHYAGHKSGILKGEKVRETFWDSWYVQEGVAPCKPGHKNRQLWKWTGIKQQPSPKSVELLGELILNDEEKFDELHWKTYFMRDPSTLDEPIATSDASAGRPPPEPLTQEEMREKFDLSRMVKWHGGAGHGARKQREWRQQVMLAKFRVFTQHLLEAMSMEYTRNVWAQVNFSISIAPKSLVEFRCRLCLKSCEITNMFRKQKQLLGPGLAKGMNFKIQRCEAAARFPTTIPSNTSLNLAAVSST